MDEREWSGKTPVPIDMVERVTRVEQRITRLEEDVKNVGAQAKSTADEAAAFSGEWKQRTASLDDMARSVKTIEIALAKDGGARDAGRTVTSWIKPVATVLIAGIVMWGAATIWGQHNNDVAARAAAQEVIQALGGKVHYTPPTQPAP